jgi:hypothetical protein
LSWDIHFSREECDLIKKHAVHRCKKKVEGGFDKSVDAKAYDVDKHIRNNAVGIVGEVSYARFLSVPWFQNPDEYGGDHGRPGDLVMRSGTAVECKTSGNPRGFIIPYYTGTEWELVAMGQWVRKKRVCKLRGVMSREFAFYIGTLIDQTAPDGSLKKGLYVEARHLAPIEMLHGAAMDTRPKAGFGLMCPWCMEKAWPCKEAACVRARQQREKLI